MTEEMGASMKPDPIGYWLERDEALPVYEMTDPGEGLVMTDLVAADDAIATLGDWCDALGVGRQAVRDRIKRGWRLVDALSISGCERLPEDVQPYEEDLAAQAFVAKQAPATLEEVGLFYGVTRERIRQIEAEALRKLRRVMPRSMWEQVEAVLMQRGGGAWAA